MIRLKTKSLSSGFTLIELLLVIVIIGILVGVVIAVINPARQQRRANEGVLRGNAGKGCLALFACSSTASAATSCDSPAENGVTALTTAPTTPVGSTYGFSRAGTVVTLTSTLPASGSFTQCVYTCTYDFANGTSTPVTKTAGTCLP